MKKTLLSEAKAALIDMMKVEGEISVDDAVDELELAKTTIRQHLQLLEQYGLVKRRQQRQGRGRPRIMYSLTEDAREFYPNLEGDLLRELVAYLIQQGHLAIVDDFFRTQWEKDEQKLLAQTRATGGSWQARMDVLGAFLSERGFLPEVGEDGQSYTVKVCNCPYRSAVSATRLPCRLESDLLENISGRRVDRVEYILDGDPCCVYEFGAELVQET